MNAYVQNIMYLSVVAEPNEICHTGSQTIQLYSIDLFKFYSLYLQRELQSFQSYNLSSATTQFQVLMFHFTQILVQYNDRSQWYLQTRWCIWEQNPPDHVSAPRSLVKCQEPIEEIDLHTFGDASGQIVAAKFVAAA